MSIRYRLLEAADATVYKQLRDASLREAPEAFTSDFAGQVTKDAQSYLGRFAPLAHLHQGKTITLGALDGDGALLGAVTCEPDVRTKKRHCADIVAMFVAGHAQRRGIASNLIAILVDTVCRNSDLSLLTLSVTASNTHTVRVYERAGFIAYGRLNRAILVGDTYFDKLLMQQWISRPTPL